MNRSKQPGSDFLQLDVAEAPPGGLADWLARRLRRAISDGRLPLGSTLPATRVLAAELRVSRGVVTEAYQRLVEDGHVVGRGRRGTVVVSVPSPTPVVPAEPPDAPAPAALFVPSPTDEVFETLRAAPARVDLSPGVPDLAAFPRAAWLRAERAVLTELPAAALGYGDPRGAPALRAAIARWLARNRGIAASPDEVLVVNGTAQALVLAGEALRRAGYGAMAVEEPGSLGVRLHIARTGLATPPVPVDEEGVRVAGPGGLRALGADAVLLTPAHQFPTGVVLSGERRRALTRWAGERDGPGGLIMEDDYDAEHRYDRPPVPALRSLLPERVCYTGSVSKLLAPALRVGWVLAPPWLHAAMVAAKRHADLGNPVLPQLVLARLMDSGELERQLRQLRVRHRRRRDAMVAALRERVPEAVVHGAAAGLHLMVTLEGPYGDVDDTRLAARALERGVKTHPLTWHRQRPGPPGLVLGYAARTPGEIEEGIEELARALA
ncbi:PLP-dependent aminotransferase family protein [Streptomyces albiaxialis]|uniref:PLP-dependent aminotransferase family protein n=1 Tax=Streptomyces albiaxialis TaxID=329523 RepID=A0ABN2VGP7_9ACTN